MANQVIDSIKGDMIRLGYMFANININFDH